uniref:WW domain-containing protein n=1 Tax=Glossina pallidipes TaxID=7398 RepID=A0A1A9Z6Y1_GLOPL
MTILLLVLNGWKRYSYSIHLRSYSSIRKAEINRPADYKLPAVLATLLPHWKFAITPQGKIYYYHIKYRISAWEPPTPTHIQNSKIEENDANSDSELTNAGDSSEDDDEMLIGIDDCQLKAYIDKKVEDRRQKRYPHLVDEKSINPRREGGRIYNQMEVRKYKESSSTPNYC